MLRPQPRQEMFLGSAADIAIFGGAAGGGKTWCLLAEPVRHAHRKTFAAVTFRETNPQINAPGGLWDESIRIYPELGAKPIQDPYRWTFPSGARHEFRYLQHDTDAINYQGAQIPLIQFDELTHFTQYRFWYLTSRNRSTCGVKPYVRATTNPDPDSWVKGLIDWYLDDNGEYADMSKAGKLRWFVRLDDDIHWFDDKAKAFLFAERYETTPKSFTFVPSYLDDNQVLMQTNPGYLATLQALPRVEKERLLRGNWKVRAGAGDVFRRSDFIVVDSIPAEFDRVVRVWDRAATEVSPANQDPDWTAGVKMARKGSTYYILDVIRMRERGAKVKQKIKDTSTLDEYIVTGLFCDPGAAGKAEYEDMVTYLAGRPVKEVPQTGKKYMRWLPLAAQAQAGNVKLVRGPWVESFLSEMENLTETMDHRHDDQADAAAGAFWLLANAPGKIAPHESEHKPVTAGMRKGGAW